MLIITFDFLLIQRMNNQSAGTAYIIRNGVGLFPIAHRTSIVLEFFALMSLGSGETVIISVYPIIPLFFFSFSLCLTLPETYQIATKLTNVPPFETVLQLFGHHGCLWISSSSLFEQSTADFVHDILCYPEQPGVAIDCVWHLELGLSSVLPVILIYNNHSSWKPLKSCLQWIISPYGPFLLVLADIPVLERWIQLTGD